MLVPARVLVVAARLVAQKLSETFRQPVTVENRPGANGMVGAQAAARSAPDGHTLVVLDRGALTINPSLYKEMNYDPLKDFVAISNIGSNPFVLGVNAVSPLDLASAYATLADGGVAHGHDDAGRAARTHAGVRSRSSDLGATGLIERGVNDDVRVKALVEYVELAGTAAHRNDA